MMLLILMLSIPLVYSKPHVPPTHAKDIVQIEKQEIRLITHEDQDTKNILNKIEEVNRNQGLVNKKSIKEKQIPNVQRLHVAKQQQFRFPEFGEFMRNPFSNPILNYMHSVQHAPVENPQLNQWKNVEINPQDQIPGQYIKRKITHQQSMIIPSSPSIMNLYNNEMPEYLPQLGFAKEAPSKVPQEDASQTVENIRNIMNNQIPTPYMYPYGYFQPGEMDYPLQRQGFFQSPLTQYFPIIIKDPIQQMMNAFTSMVEYGPPPQQSNPQPACDGSKKNQIKTTDDHQPQTNKQLEIEDLELSGDKEKPVKFTVKLNGRDESQRLVKDPKTSELGRINNKLPGLATVLGIRKTNKTSEDTKGGFLFPSAQQPEKNKEYSQDNIGNGIFLHKLRVREGGVAIAGPGGIATAGNGGTAIVGPDGYAYTQPDSLAIAGSGTKVIAVNPGIDLGQLVKNITKSNGELNSRIGRVVAVGPVVYYNKG